MVSQDDIRREMDPRPEYQPAGKKRKPARTRTQTPARKKQPTAGVWASGLAQDWYDRGTRAGFEFPYDVNYFALALDKKVRKDSRINKMLEDGRSEQATRWVRKMIERWWEEYVTEEVRQTNAKDFFLKTDWDDVREYARTCLRAAYLKKHGRKVQAPLYPNQQEYQETLARIRETEKVEALLRKDEEAPERPALDEHDPDRLRSWREKRRKK